MTDALTSQPVKRRRRTQVQIEQLERQILDVMRDDHPQSIRHVYYRMTNPRLDEPVEKTDNGYDQVQQRMTKLRREDRLPYGWVTDHTRRGHHVSTFDGASDFIERMTGLYRANLWNSAEHYVEVWCESRSIAGVIEADCNELAVSLYPCGGFSSISLAHQAAEYVNAQADGRPVDIIYIGDYDPAGVLIDQSLETELRRHLDWDVEMTFHRIAITREQIETYDLPTKPRKKGDRRVLDIQETVEAEAMPAWEMREILRENVECFLPEDALRIAKVAEESEQKALRGLAEMVRDSE